MTCFFCLQELGEDEVRDRHHVVARRYLKHDRQLAKRMVVPVHPGCHAVAHRKWDRPDFSWPVYVFWMCQINWGWGLLSRL